MTEQEARLILASINPATGQYDPAIAQNSALVNEARAVNYGTGSESRLQDPSAPNPTIYDRPPQYKQTQSNTNTYTPQTPTYATPATPSAVPQYQSSPAPQYVAPQPTVTPIPSIPYGQAGTAAMPITDTGFATAEPLQMAEQNRIFSKAWLDSMLADTRATQNRYQDQEQYFLNQALTGPGGYGNILGGGAGYTPDQQQNLLQQDLLMSGVATPEKLNQQYLTAQEQQGIYGDPDATFHYAEPLMGNLDAIRQLGTGNIRGAADYMTNLYDVGTTERIPNLQVSSGYLPGQQNVIRSTATGYNEIIDPRYLGVSDEYWNNYNVTPRDVQSIKDAAARRIMLNTQAQNEALERRSAAAGNASPLAIAAAKNRAGLYGDINAADAALNANIAGRQLQLNTTAARESQRLDSERDIANRGTEALQHLSGMSYGLGQDYENMRLAAERDVSDRLMQRATDEGNLRTALEANIAAQHGALGQYQVDKMTGLLSDAEKTSSQRAADIAANRQQTGQQNIDTSFTQAYPASQALASGYGNIYGQQKAEEQEGRGFLSGQQGAAQEGAMATRQQNIGAAGTALGAIGDATSTSIEAKYIPTWLERFGGIF